MLPAGNASAGALLRKGALRKPLGSRTPHPSLKSGGEGHCQYQLQSAYRSERETCRQRSQLAHRSRHVLAATSQFERSSRLRAHEPRSSRKQSPAPLVTAQKPGRVERSHAYLQGGGWPVEGHGRLQEGHGGLGRAMEG